jgi:hypothetical protein
VISPFALQSVEQRSAEPNRTGDETRPTSAAGNQRALTSSRRLITRLVALIPGALDGQPKRASHSIPQPIGVHESSDRSRRNSADLPGSHRRTIAAATVVETARSPISRHARLRGLMLVTPRPKILLSAVAVR